MGGLGRGAAGGVGWLASAWETGSTPPRLAASVKLGAARGRRSALHIPERERVAGAVLLLVSPQGVGPTSGSGRIKGFPALGFQASGVGSVTCNYVSNSHHIAIARDICSSSSARETVTAGLLRPAAGDTPMVSLRSEVPFASPAAAKSGPVQVCRGGAGPQAPRGPCSFARGSGCTTVATAASCWGRSVAAPRSRARCRPLRGPERGRFPYRRSLATPGAGRA